MLSLPALPRAMAPNIAAHTINMMCPAVILLSRLAQLPLQEHMHLMSLRGVITAPDHAGLPGPGPAPTRAGTPVPAAVSANVAATESYNTPEAEAEGVVPLTASDGSLVTAQQLNAGNLFTSCIAVACQPGANC